MFIPWFSWATRPQRLSARSRFAQLSLERLENRLALAADFGDAPFLVLLAEDGARHGTLGPQLGTQRDSEADGNPSTLADGDDNAGDDENAVQFPQSFRQGETVEVIVAVENAPAGAKLDAWLDFNQDQDWDDPGEQIAVSLDVVEGENTLSVQVPNTALVGQTYARFRLSSAGGLAPIGSATDGEVEDYHVFIAPDRANTSLRTGTLDTTHYIPPFFGVDGLDEHFLWLSTPETNPVSVTISNAAGSVNHTVQVSRASPVVLNLTQDDLGVGAVTNGLSLGSGINSLGLVDAEGLNQVNATDGLILNGDSGFYANVRHADPLQGGSLTAKGQTAFGTEFRSGHLNTLLDTTNANLRAHFISVIATEENTTVTFELPSNLVFADGASTFTGSTVTSPVLQQGESYVIGLRFTDNLGSVLNDLNGTLITSNLPVVVNSGSWLAGNGAGQDIGIDQLLPTNRLGTEYILAKGLATTLADDLETPIVVAHFDNTQVFINGSTTPLATLNAGEYLVIPGSNFTASNTLYLRTSQPASVFQTTAGANSSANVGLNFVVPLNESILPQEVVIPQVDQLGIATLRVIAPAGTDVFLDGTLLTNPQALPGGLELYTTIDSGDAVITSDEPLYVSLTTISGARTTAAYFSGVPNAIATSDESFVATGRTITLDVQANDLSVGQTFQVLAVSDAPNGTTLLHGDGTISYTADDGFIGIDTFQYQVESLDGTITDFGTVTIEVLPNTFAFTTDVFNAFEGDTTNTVQAVFVRREGTLDRTASVDVNISPSNQPPEADASDFTPEVVTVAFAMGQQVAAVPVEVLGDFMLEADETIALALQGNAVAMDQPTATLVLLNDEATLQSDTANILEDQSVTVDVFGNDAGIVPDELPILLVDPVHGTTTVNADGTILYTPAAHFAGTDSLSYAVSEPGNPSATLTITITPVVDDPGLSTTPTRGVANVPLPVEISIVGSPDTDGSEVLGNVVIPNLPAALTFSAGTQTAAGWEIPIAALEGLTVRSSAAESFDLQLEVTNTDTPDQEVFSASLSIEALLALFPTMLSASMFPPSTKPTTLQVPRNIPAPNNAFNDGFFSRLEFQPPGTSPQTLDQSPAVLSDDFFSEFGQRSPSLQENQLPFPSPSETSQLPPPSTNLVETMTERETELTQDNPQTPDESDQLTPPQDPFELQPGGGQAQPAPLEGPGSTAEPPEVIAQAENPAEVNNTGNRKINPAAELGNENANAVAEAEQVDTPDADGNEPLEEKPRGTIPTILALMALLYGAQQNRAVKRPGSRRSRNQVAAK